MTWKLTLEVLRPNWPVRAKEIVSTDSNGESLTMDQQLRPFREAYENQEIFITNGDSPVEYSFALPAPEGMSEEEWFVQTSLGAQLVQSGAFTKVDSFECTFVADVPESTRLGIGAGETFTFEDYAVEFEWMDVSFTRASYAFRRVYPKGVTPSTNPVGPAYVLMDQAGTLLSHMSGSIEKPETRGDGTVAILYRGEAAIQGDMPTSIRFVAATHGAGQWDTQDSSNYDDAHSFTVVIDQSGTAQ